MGKTASNQVRQLLLTTPILTASKSDLFALSKARFKTIKATVPCNWIKRNYVLKQNVIGMDHLAPESYSTSICREEKDLDSWHRRSAKELYLLRGQEAQRSLRVQVIFFLFIYFFPPGVLVNSSRRCFPPPPPTTERKHTALRTKATAMKLEYVKASKSKRRGLVLNVSMLMVRGMRNY